MNKLLIVLIVFAVACVFMFKYLPIWASLVIVVLGLFSLRWIIPYMAHRLFMAPFKMKGKALSGAEIEIHAVRPAAAPELSENEDDEEDFDEDDYSEYDYSEYAWYHVDVTITPHPKGEGFTYWEPGELMLVGPDAVAVDVDGDEADIHDLRVFAGGAFREYEGEKYEGPQRLELHVGVKRGFNALQFRYYFELFGHVPIPAKPTLQ